MSHTLKPPIVESAVVNSIKIESVEQRIETEDSLRSTILSQQHQIEELRQHIKYIENNKKEDTESFDYFL